MPGKHSKKSKKGQKSKKKNTGGKSHKPDKKYHYVDENEDLEDDEPNDDYLGYDEASASAYLGDDYVVVADNDQLDLNDPVTLETPGDTDPATDREPDSDEVGTDSMPRDKLGSSEEEQEPRQRKRTRSSHLQKDTSISPYTARSTDTENTNPSERYVSEGEREYQFDERRTSQQRGIELSTRNARDRQSLRTADKQDSEDVDKDQTEVEDEVGRQRDDSTGHGSKRRGSRISNPMSQPTSKTGVLKGVSASCRQEYRGPNGQQADRRRQSGFDPYSKRSSSSSRRDTQQRVCTLNLCRDCMERRNSSGPCQSTVRVPSNEDDYKEYAENTRALIEESPQRSRKSSTMSTQDSPHSLKRKSFNEKPRGSPPPTKRVDISGENYSKGRTMGNLLTKKPKTAFDMLLNALLAFFAFFLAFFLCRTWNVLLSAMISRSQLTDDVAFDT